MHWRSKLWQHWQGPILNIFTTINNLCVHKRKRGVTGTQGNRPRKSSPASITAAEAGPPALLVTMAENSRLACTVAWCFKNSGPMHCTPWFFFPSSAWRVFASLMSWSYGVIESIICSEWLPPWDYKKLQVALVTRELSVILNYWHIFMWYSPKSRTKFSYSSMKSKTQSPPQGKGGI